MQRENVEKIERTPSNRSTCPEGSGKRGSTALVFEKKSITEVNLPEIREFVSPEQHEHILPGDLISILCFINTPKRSGGIITIWHNRPLAAMTTGNGTIFGTWVESQCLIVTSHTDDAWTTTGQEILGKIAYNLCGEAGIYSCGEFYRQA